MRKQRCLWWGIQRKSTHFLPTANLLSGPVVTPTTVLSEASYSDAMGPSIPAVWDGLVCCGKQRRRAGGGRAMCQQGARLNQCRSEGGATDAVRGGYQRTVRGHTPVSAHPYPRVRTRMRIASSSFDPATTFCRGGFPTCTFPAWALHCPHLKPCGDEAGVGIRQGQDGPPLQRKRQRRAGGEGQEARKEGRRPRRAVVHVPDCGHEKTWNAAELEMRNRVRAL